MTMQKTTKTSSGGEKNVTKQATTKQKNAPTVDPAALAAARAHFEEHLRDQDLKLTGQRFEILERVANINRHFTADDLVDEFRRVRGGPSKSTIYRTLALLTECEILEEHKFAHNPSSVYELAWGRHHHDHLVCLSCGTIFEFFDQRLEDAQEVASREQGFMAMSHSLKVYGVCAPCRKKSEPTK
jgi:Fur family ferric uptake transcriptional regulator